MATKQERRRTDQVNKENTGPNGQKKERKEMKMIFRWWRNWFFFLNTLSQIGIQDKLNLLESTWSIGFFLFRFGLAHWETSNKQQKRMLICFKCLDIIDTLFSLRLQYQPYKFNTRFIRRLSMSSISLSLLWAVVIWPFFYCQLPIVRCDKCK